MSRGAIATINLSALQHNYARIKHLVGHCAVLAMIKSNGYGHGLLRIARALSTADALGVASLDEAIVLREAGIQQPIVVMAGFYNAAELPHFVEQALLAVIHHTDQLVLLEKTPLRAPLSVWLKIDTGMHRLGFAVEQVAAVYQRLSMLPSVKKPIGLMTHLAQAEYPDRSFTEAQIHQFTQVTRGLSEPRSVVNSAGILFYREAWLDWVRPGIVLYGVSPLPGRTGLEEGLQPVMTLTGRLMSVKTLRKDERVGYGGMWICPEDMPVGIVGVGYGDGYPRHAKNGTPTLVHGKWCPLVGCVSMDMITIDLRVCPEAQVGDTVVLWGEGLPIEKVAACAETIPYELLCRVTQRVEFH